MENSNDPKPLKDCLTGPSLGRLVTRTRHITAIKKILQNWLPAELAPHCEILNIENGILTLASESAAFVTALRYLMPELIHTLNNTASLPTVKQIVYRVIPSTEPRLGHDRRWQISKG